MATQGQSSDMKWINATIAAAAVICSIVFYSLVIWLGDWFQLEAYISRFVLVAQIVAILGGLGSFIFIRSNKRVTTYLDEVMGELAKVIWPEKNSVTRLTIGILIWLVIVGIILAFVDYITRILLQLLY
jgi:preprotein translocase SecE subunit